ncbi:DUF6300 family protein [Streptomyces sp. NPDC053750]|uniref:DUF6300 family protein n=1 Tax=Streptomyces sp. NPDC053750 TaxID=3365714 RepID=UPI0037D60A02
MTDGDEIAVRVVDRVPPCARCGGAVLLRVRFGHSWTNIAGHTVDGFREADLCPGCDCGETPAENLLAHLTVAERIPVSSNTELAGHVAAWVESVRQSRVDMELLKREEQAHRRHGELP